MGDRRLLKASEIGEYVYCKRAWWFHHVRGMEPTNAEELSHGNAFHRAHGRAVALGDAARKAALALIAIAILLVVAWLATSILAGAL